MTKHAQFAQQSPKARKWYRRAYQVGANAASLYDVGIARGLLLALKRDDIINKSTLDKMFKAILETVPKRYLRHVPPKDRAQLGKGVVAPASLRTRRKRKSRLSSRGDR
jgi:hypothetical protein